MSLCFAQRLVVLKFFFGASGFRKFHFGAPGRDDCPGRGGQPAHAGRGAPPDGRLNEGLAPGVVPDEDRGCPGRTDRL